VIGNMRLVSQPQAWSRMSTCAIVTSPSTLSPLAGSQDNIAIVAFRTAAR
jgi:hypothetical protein